MCPGGGDRSEPVLASSSMALAALLSSSQDCLESIMDLGSSWFVKTFNK